jgi:hypothetical protein
LSLSNNFGLRYALSNMSITIPALLLASFSSSFEFYWNSYRHLFLSSLIMMTIVIYLFGGIGV